MPAPQRILLAGGGSGGHLFPGVAVAEVVRARWPACECLFVGSERGIEQTILAPWNWPVRSLSTQSLAMFWKHPLRFFAENWSAWRTAGRWLDELRPDAVIGLGGYAGWPMLWWATRRKIPTLLLEANVIPGRVTRLFARSASVVCTAFEESHPHLPTAKRLLHTGNPVRAEFANFACESPPDNEHPTLLVLGGSQGAIGVNEMLLEAVGQNPSDFHHWNILHQTGESQCDFVRSRYAVWRLKAEVQPFFHDIATVYRRATLVVSRAGGTTLAELACTGLPTILIPYPQAADQHQQRNAEVFARAGATEILDQTASLKSAGGQLHTCLVSIAGDREKQDRMSRAMRTLSRPHAAEQVVNCLAELLETGSASSVQV